GAGDGQLPGNGAGSEEQCLVLVSTAVARAHHPRGAVDGGDVGSADQLDAGVGVEVGGPERQPVFGCGAGQVVLGEVGPVDGRLLADHPDRPLVALATQFLGG